MQNVNNNAGGAIAQKTEKKRSTRQRSKKNRKQAVPKNFGGHSGFAEGDRFRDAVAHAMQQLLNRPLTTGELHLALTILDGGHSYEIMRDCAAYPDNESSANEIFHNAQQFDFDVTVVAGKSCQVYQLNHPQICAVVINDGVWSAIPWMDALALRNPGRFFGDKGVLAYRKLASTITATNSTPMNDRGGICYSDVVNLQWFTQNLSPTMNPATTMDNNNPVVYGMATNATNFTTSDSYRTGSESGAYVIARATSREWSKCPGGQEYLTSAYAANTAPSAGDKDHQLKYIPIQGNKEAIGTPMFYNSSIGVVGGRPVILPFCSENFEAPAVCFQSPGRDQLIHFKIHAMWEYLLDSSAENNFPKRTKSPNPQFLSAIEDACQQFPQLLPPEYNSWGAIGRWFQKVYKGLKPALDPMISTALGPLAGNAINASLDSLSRISI